MSEDPSLVPLIASIIISIASGSAVTAFVVAWFNRSKTSTEAKRTSAEAADLIEQAASRTMNRLMTENDRISEEIGERIRQISLLQAKLDSLGQSVLDMRDEHRREIGELKDHSDRERAKCDAQLAEMRSHINIMRDELQRAHLETGRPHWDDATERITERVTLEKTVEIVPDQED